MKKDKIFVEKSYDFFFTKKSIELKWESKQRKKMYFKIAEKEKTPYNARTMI